MNCRITPKMAIESIRRAKNSSHEGKIERLLELKNKALNWSDKDAVELFETEIDKTKAKLTQGGAKI